MPNIIFSVLASPDKHKQIVKDINSWKYDIEGEQFKGKQAPAIHEFKMYEVRVPPEIEADFVRDFNLHLGYGQVGVAKSLPMRILYGCFEILRFFSPFKALDTSKKGEEHKYSFAGTWHYAFPLGKLKRKPMKVKFGKDRDVL
jgi:hypothetical protein